MRNVIFLLAAGTALASCSTEKFNPGPDVALTENYKNRTGRRGDTINPETRWWANFGDRNLNSLIDEALANNLSIEAARERVVAAKEAGAAGKAAAEEAKPATEATATGWKAVTEALSDYAKKAKDIGADIGQALVGAFQSAENAVGEFVKTGKLDFRDLVTSLLADLSKLAARRFLLGPIANALSGALGGAGGIFASIMHTGGMVGTGSPSRMVPAYAFAGAPRMHSGGMVGLRHDEVPAILQRGERVLSRREAQDYGHGVTVNINARDAESFRQSRTQIAADIARAVSLGRRGL